MKAMGIRELGIKFDAVVSVDLGWSPKTENRTAVAYWTAADGVGWNELERPSALARFLHEFPGLRALVLLDIPIHDTTSLDRLRPFRGLDRSLMRMGIPMLPSYRAGTFGCELATEIESEFPGFEVVESYPYAALRFLWAVRGNPRCLDGPPAGVVDEETWMRDWPPKYKRARAKKERLRCMSMVQDTIAAFMPSAGCEDLRPEESLTLAELNRLADVYDALLALLVGIKLVEGLEWVLEAGVSGEDAVIPILVDDVLRTRWERARSIR